MSRTSVVRWVHEKDIVELSKDIKSATRSLHRALEALSSRMETLGYSDEQITERIRREFFASARQVIKEES